MSNLQTLPTNTPAEALQISPEALEVANCYLQDQNISSVATALGIPAELVSEYLERREVRAYINQVFYNLGFNNRFRISDAMDAIISKKFREMDEADVGSTKDITEILAMKHKMLMEHMAHELAMAKLNASNIKTQTNIQINSQEGGSKYASLIERLMTRDV